MARRVKAPTYKRDVVGPVKQWDERDTLFARRDLFRFFGPNSAEFAQYYKDNPGRLAYDRSVHRMGPLGKTGGPDVPMFEAQFEAAKTIADEAAVDGEPARGKTEIPPGRAALKVKALARLMGADLVGIGPLRQEWVYSNVGRSFGNSPGFARWGEPVDLRNHTTAVALGFAMDRRMLQCSPDFPVIVATASGYSIGAWVSIQLARYIRMMGYSARAHHVYNYRVLAVPVAVDCGLGELSRAGYLLTMEYGLGLRLAVVTTDMPLEHDSPVDIAAQSFCEGCLLCAESCPVDAIPQGEKVEFNGLRKWKLDEERCYRYWHAVGTDCALCMVSCPWTKPENWLHRLTSRAASVRGPHQKLLVYAEKLFYGKFKGAARPGFFESLPRQARSRR